MKAKDQLPSDFLMNEGIKFIIDNSPFPIAVVDENDQNILYWSKSASKLFGHNPKTSEEWHGLAYPDPQYRKSVLERWKPYLEIAQKSSIAVNTGEYEIHCKNGALKFCEIYVQSMPGSLIVTLNDITKRKKTEEQLLALNQQLLANEQQLRAANQQLKANDQQLRSGNQQLQANEQELIESKNRLNYIIENSTNLFYSHTADHVITFISHQVRKILQYEPEEVMQRWTEFITDNPINIKALKYTEEALKTGKRQPTYELELIRKDGKKILVEVRESPVVKNGKVESIVGSLSEITERKQAEERLRESEEKFRSLIHQSPFVVELYDIDGLQIEVNKAYEELWNFPAETTLNKFNVLKSKEVVDSGLISYVKRAYLGEFVKVPDYKFDPTGDTEAKGKGRTRWLDTRIYPLEESLGKVTHIVITHQDITERKRAEEELTHSRDLMRYIIEHNKSAVAVHDRDLNYLYVSQDYLEQYNVKQKDVIGRHHYEIFPDLPQKWRDVHKRALAGEISRADEDIYKRADGTIEWTRWECRPWFDTDGSIGGIIVYTEIITERKNAEEQLKAINQQLQTSEQKLRAINQQLKANEQVLRGAVEKAEESDRLKSAFLANMSHEIRTPMNGILGFTGLLKEADLTGERREKYIDIIEKSGDRMLNTINDIIDISRIESGEMKVSIKPTNINSQLESLFEFFRPECDKKKIKLEIFPGLDNNAAGIQTDPEKLYAILANLIKNAIKYTPKGSIEYGYTHEDSMIHFYVNDTGEGIKSDRLDSIFERFVREDNSDIDSKQGSGLGLSIVKGYVELLDGEIWVESEKGKGSSFHFTIPDKFSAEESKRSEPVVASKEDRINTLSNKTILIVEDDEISFDFLEIVIRSFGVKNILLAKDGNESVRLCKENQSIDLVLMDINLPGISGYDATKAIRKFNRDLPIISQTAYAISGDRKRSMEAGCNDYISKPIKKEDLLEKLEKFLFKD